MLLAGEFFRIEDRILEDVAEDVERQRDVVLEHARIVRGGLDAGRGVDFTPDRLDLLGDLGRGTRRGALEGHVLEEVREAVLVVAFRARAGADPDAERRALQMVHLVRDDPEAGLETRYANRHTLKPYLRPRGRVP